MLVPDWLVGSQKGNEEPTLERRKIPQCTSLQARSCRSWATPLLRRSKTVVLHAKTWG